MNVLVLIAILPILVMLMFGVSATSIIQIVIVDSCCERPMLNCLTTKNKSNVDANPFASMCRLRGLACGGRLHCYARHSKKRSNAECKSHIRNETAHLVVPVLVSWLGDSGVSTHRSKVQRAAITNACQQENEVTSCTVVEKNWVLHYIIDHSRV